MSTIELVYRLIGRKIVKQCFSLLSGLILLAGLYACDKPEEKREGSRYLLETQWGTAGEETG